MSKRKTKKSNNLIAVGVLAVAALGVGSLAYYVRSEPAAQIPIDLREQPNSTAAQPEDPKPEQTTSVRLFIPVESGMDLVFKEETAQVRGATKPELFAVQEFLRRSEAAPTGTRLLSMEIIDGVALLHFNPALNSGMGSFQERALVGGLERNLGQFSNITAFNIFIEGARVTSIGEHFELEDPHPVIR